MEEKLRGIVAQIGEISPDFAVESHLRDELNIDSFRAVEIVFEVERIFKIKIPDSRVGKVQTFDDLLRLVTEIKG